MSARSGVILIDKSQGMSSAQVVGALKKKLNLKKIGHAGTLDPMATGLLVCLTGKATRLASFAEGGRKTYSGEIRMGLTTDSDDITGKELTVSHEIPEFDRIQDEIENFTGPISQIPPRVSAIKVDGKRAYKLVREGKEVELKAREVEVDEFSIEAVDSETIKFIVRCSKGTYIRSLARDLGEKLGCGGCLSAIRREASVPFEVSKASLLEDASLESIQDWRKLFPETPVCEVSEEDALYMLGGDERALLRTVVGFESEWQESGKVIYKCSESEKSLGLLVFEKGMWKFGVNIGEV